MASYILALDQGTTSSRAILFDQNGSPQATSQVPIEQSFPTPGWVEHDAMEIWESQLATARDVLRQANLSSKDVSAIGITNQRETTVLWDRSTGKPVYPAIVWQDRRTVEECLRLAGDERMRELIHQKTGLLIDAYFSATKLQWLLDNVPGARARAERGELAFGTIDSWLTWKLTGGRVHATDSSNASRTLLMNIQTLDWDDELLEIFHIPRAVLPTIVASNAHLGDSDAQWFGSGIALTARVGDQQAATFGQACFKPGMAKNTYGTGCFLLMNTGHQPPVSQNRLLSTVGWSLNAGDSTGASSGTTAPTRAATTYCLEGSVFMGGAVVQWLRDGLGLIDSAPEVEALAASVMNTGDVMLVPAFTGLGAPLWDGLARGTIVGMTRGTTKAHIARAALESIAFQVADVLEAMQADAHTPITELRVDGGASANNLLLQMQADLLGLPVIRPKVTETTALGAAYLAGLSAGIWKTPSDLSAHWALDRTFTPQDSDNARQARRARWQEAVSRSRAWARG
jgi:glycerol kinase